MRYLLALIAICCAAELAAQDAELIYGDVLYEDDPNRTLISKPGWLRGLHLLGDDLDPEERPLITAPIPAANTKEIFCARITSISGNYEALIQFVVPGTPAGTAPKPVRKLTFTSEFPDMVKKITSADSGVTVHRGGCAGDAKGVSRYIATFWNNSADALVQNAAPSAELVLNMNVARADEILAAATLRQTGGAAALPEPSCKKVDRLEALAFNYRCAVTVPLAALQGSATTLIDFSFEALYRGRTSPRRTAEIEIGAVR